MKREKIDSSGRRLNVLVIPGWYPSREKPVSGIFVKEYVKAVELFNNVAVLYSEGYKDCVRGIYEISEEVEEGIRTLRLRYQRFPLPKTTYFIYLYGMYKAFKKLLNEGFKPDIIHAHIYSAGFTAVLLGKIFHIPVIISEHFSGFSRKSIRGFERLKAKFAFENASLVCPVSEDLKRHIQSYGINAKFHVIPNVVNISLFYPKDRSPTKSNKKRILLVALLDPAKGISSLLKALAHLREIRDDFFLDIVGDGPYRAEYEELSRKLNLSDVVFFHGLKPKEEVAECMRQSDFLVLPSQYETFGVVLVEAMACGKPVIGADAGGPREIIREEFGKLFSPGDCNDLTSAINYMLDHYQDYSSEKIAQYAREHYNHAVVGKKLDEVYRYVISRGGIKAGR
jgi:glycosyltransferase involved in cell wall biosynthesis